MRGGKGTRRCRRRPHPHAPTCPPVLPARLRHTHAYAPALRLLVQTGCTAVSADAAVYAWELPERFRPVAIAGRALLSATSPQASAPATTLPSALRHSMSRPEDWQQPRVTRVDPLTNYGSCRLGQQFKLLTNACRITCRASTEIPHEQRSSLHSLFELTDRWHNGVQLFRHHYSPLQSMALSREADLLFFAWAGNAAVEVVGTCDVLCPGSWARTGLVDFAVRDRQVVEMQHPRCTRAAPGGSAAAHGSAWHGPACDVGWRLWLEVPTFMRRTGGSRPSEGGSPLY